MNIVFLILALFSEVAGTTSLKLSHGFSKRTPVLAMVVFSGLSLILLSFALTQGSAGFEVDVVYTAWSVAGIAFIAIIELLWKQREQWNGRDIGPIGTTARMVLGFGLAGSVIHAQLSTRFAPATHAPARLRARPRRLPRSRAGLALVAYSPPPGAFPRHQPSKLCAQRRAAPRPLPHLVVCARLLRHQRRGAPLRWRFHGARSTARLRRLRDASPLQLAAAPLRPDRLRRLYAHRLAFCSEASPLNEVGLTGGCIHLSSSATGFCVGRRHP